MAVKSSHSVVSGWTVDVLTGAGPGWVDVSLDLGLTRTRVYRDEHVLHLPDGRTTLLSALREEAAGPEDCLTIDPAGRPEKVYRFSEARGKYYKLFQPELDMAPTIVINNATMHRIKGGGPWDDVCRKVAVQGLGGQRCLDTCCGLGYSAQLVAEKTGGVVISCEADGHVLDTAAVNPWSSGLFDNERIEVIPVDVRDYLRECGHDAFDMIFHDPPTVFQAGELYSGALYRQLAGALRRGGVLYHYTGVPGKKQGKDYVRGVMRRLEQAGFRQVAPCYGGVTALCGA